jgi:hypothetical protein
MVIMDAYPVGTTPQIDPRRRFTIPSNQVVEERMVAFVTPILAKKGEPWTGKFIIVDQFLRKHKTQKATFKFVGPPPQV